ncbi:MAG: hypothetical protein ACXABY_01785 [Candidatus Thorarchaeota archaeon]|jgi:predicted transcriptional regulator
MSESFDILFQILQTGAVGAMLIMTWRLMVKKDRKSYEMIEAMNEERKELYDGHSEMVAEVTAALVNKNNTDDKMATAITKLAEEYRDLRDVIKELNNEAS